MRSEDSVCIKQVLWMTEKIKGDGQKWDNNVNVFFEISVRWKYKNVWKEITKWIYFPLQMKGVSWIQLGKFYFVARDIYCLGSVDTMWAKGMVNAIRVGTWEL